MKINRNNYEIFFIDYLDGTLDESQVDGLLVFLDENPDLKEEFESLDIVKLEADTAVRYTGKQELMKKNILSVGPVNEQNYQEYLIGNLEGDLSLTEERLLQRFIQRNPHVARELDMYKAAILSPDPDIVFPEKRKLKKHPMWMTYRKPVYYLTGVAATLLLFLLVFDPFSKKEPPVALKDHVPVTSISKAESTTLATRENNSLPGDQESRDNDIPQASSHATDQVSQNRIVYQQSAVISNGKKEHMLAAQTDDHPKGSLTVLPGIHKEIQYQLVNASFNPAEHIPYSERNNYSQVLPYLVMTDQYTLSSAQQTSARSYGSFGEFAWNKFKGVFTGKQGNQKPLSNFSLWSLADIGVEGINQLTDSELHIQRIKDEEGNIISYALIKEDQEVTRTRNKNNPAQGRRYE